MSHFVTVAPPLALWAAVAYRRSYLLSGSPWGPAARATAAALGWLAVSLTLFVPSVSVGFDRQTGVPNLSQLFIDAFALLAGGSVVTALLHERYPPAQARTKARARRHALFLVIAGLAGLFLLAKPSTEAIHFAAQYANSPAVAWFLVTYHVVLGCCVLEGALLAWRTSTAEHGVLRLALLGTAGGQALGLVYCGYNIAYVVSRCVSPGPGLLPDPLTGSRAMLVPIALLLAVATTLPDWGTRLHLGELRHRGREYRARQRMFGLWYDLYYCTPSLSLERRSQPPFHPSRAALQDQLALIENPYRLHRRVIEMYDGWRALHEYLPAQLPDDLPAPEAAAVGVAQAMSAKIAGHRAESRTPQGFPITPVQYAGDFAAEVQALLDIAEAYETSARVRAVWACSPTGRPRHRRR